MSSGPDPSAKQLFLDAAELERTAREAFLERACAGRPGLRERVEALLAAHERADLFGPIEVLPVDLAAGERVGPYRLVERLGEGGFGVVWRAQQEHPVRREVALKVIKLGMDTAQIVRRFDVERQALALMDHPGIARVFDAGATEQGRPYFAMELVRGSSITEHCNRERADLEERLRLFVAVCQAVQHAHQKGLIHRDLKPSNLLVARHDGVATPKVIDFGIAKATRAELAQQTLLTQQGQVIGSPMYMAPEQMQLGGEDVDTRADVYSLGVVLYELLTGSPPFDPGGGSYEDFARALREQDPTRPSVRVARDTGDGSRAFGASHARLARVLRRDLDWIAMKALEKERARRYESVGAFAADVKRFLADEPVEASPPSVLYRLRKTARRHRITVLTLGAVSLALAIGAGLAFAGLLRARQQELLAKDARGVAEAEAARAQEERDRANAVVGLLQRMLNSPGEDREKGPDYPVRALLADFAQGLGDELAGEPRVEATIRATIGSTYLVLDLPAAARPHLVRARELKHELLGPHAPETLLADVDYARLLSQEGRFAEAESLFRATIPELEHAKGLDARSLPIARSYMAATLGKLGKFEEAEEVIRAAYTDVEERDVLGQAVLTNDLALLRQNRGDFAEAERLFLEALELHAEAARAGAGNLVEEAKTLNNLGIVLMSQERLEEAETYLRRGVALMEEVAGTDSPLAWRTRHNLGRVLTVRGELEEAEPLLEEALAAVRESTPPGHPDRGSILSAVSLLYDRQGRHAESLELALEALEVRRTALGPDHLELASSLYNIGCAYQGDERFDEAERYMREALRLVLLHEGGTPYRPRVYSSLSMVLEEQGELEEALETMARACSTSLAMGDTVTAGLARERAAGLAERVEDDLVAAEGLLAGDLFEEAEPRALAALERAQDERERRRARVAVGRVLVHAGALDEAEPMLLGVWEELGGDGAGADEEATQRATGRALLELYAASDRPAELEAWRTRLAERESD